VANEETASMSELIELVGELAGAPVRIERFDAAAGDARRTGGSSQLAREVLGWSPSTSLRDGVAAMLDWCREHPPVPRH
jgi:nucleoside-diphosphate-sugar epimerase